MKKLIPFIFSIYLTLFLTACSQNSENKVAIDISSKTSSNVSDNTAEKLSKDDISGITFGPIFSTNDKIDIERFIQIIENATPIQEKPEAPAGSLVFDFSILTPNKNIEKRNFSLNSAVLYEILDDGTVKYYLLDKNSEDFKFLMNICGNYLK